jgi:hypothetical protein
MSLLNLFARSAGTAGRRPPSRPSASNTLRAVAGASLIEQTPEFPTTAPPAQEPLTTEDRLGLSDILSYPADILDKDKYGGNYMVIFINVHSESKLASPDNAEAFLAADDQSRLPPRMRGVISGIEVSNDAFDAALTLGGVYVANRYDPVGRTINALGNPLGVSGDGKVATAGNVVVGAKAGKEIAKRLGPASPRYKAMKHAIAMNIPNNLSINYSADWDSSDMAISSAVLQTVGASAPDAVKSFSNIVNDAAQRNELPAMSDIAGFVKGAVQADISAGVGVSLNYGASKLLETPIIGGAISKITGTAPNPQREQLFSGIKHRSFSMSFDMAARNPSESTQIHDIVRTLKMHMLPEYKDDNKFLYVYPSEFDIVYFKDGKVNERLHKHTSCVLTSMEVSYSPNSNFTTFPNGSPTFVSISLSFTELGLVTRDEAAKGY